MKTNDLIDLLARESGAAPRLKRWRNLAIALTIGLSLALLLIVSAGMVRPDIGAARMPVMFKTVFSAVIAAAALPLLLRLSRPGRPIGTALIWIGGAAALAVILFAISMMGPDPAGRARAVLMGVFPWCVIYIPILAAPAAAALFWFMRGLAPTNLAAAGAAIGAAAGGVGAMAYAMYCPIDAMDWVTLWYAVAIGLCAAIGAIIGSRLLRW